MADQPKAPFISAAFSWSKPAREVTRDSYFPEGSPGAPAMPTYPTKKGLHLIRRALMHLNEPVTHAVCGRCERPLKECQADQWGDARLILECRDAEIELLKRRLEEALRG